MRVYKKIEFFLNIYVITIMSDDDITLSDVDGWDSDVNYNSDDNSDENFEEEARAYVARKSKFSATVNTIRQNLDLQKVKKEQGLIREQLLEEDGAILTTDHLKAEQTLTRRKQCEFIAEKLKDNTKLRKSAKCVVKRRRHVKKQLKRAIRKRKFSKITANMSEEDKSRYWSDLSENEDYIKSVNEQLEINVTRKLNEYAKQFWMPNDESDDEMK